MVEPPADAGGARILAADDVPGDLEVLCQALQAVGHQVTVASSGEAFLDLAERFAPDLVLLGVAVPGLDSVATCRRLKQGKGTRSIPVIVLTAAGDTAGLVEAFRAGASDCLVNPYQEDEVLARIHTQLERATLLRELEEKNAALEERARGLDVRNRALVGEIARRQAFPRERNHVDGRVSLAGPREVEPWGLGELVGQSETLKKVLDDLDLLQGAQTASVLILGESGTGKELIARAIHAGSDRAQGPFVPLNCATIPRELADSLLFGHVRGAFTGAARDQAGYFELAHGGTLFLDEVGLMPLELQPKLLRVLEDGAILSLGAPQPRKVDVRVVAATNVGLQAQIQGGTFRQDLYFRLARFTMQVPPLRQRRDDIGLLARHFVQAFALEMGIVNPAVSQEAVRLLEGHDFPGNIRELKNLVERGLIESRGAEIRPEHLQRGLVPAAQLPAASPVDCLADLPMNLAQAERLLIMRAVARAKGNISEAARLLGVERTKIYRRLRHDRRHPPAD